MISLRNALVALAAFSVHVAATEYYVDCSASKDGSGTKASPWNTLSKAADHTLTPGDVLALRTGTTCTGAVELKGNGSSSAQVTLTNYVGKDGSTEKPIVNGNGSTAAITLTNPSYWTIRNISLTNPASSLERRAGLWLVANDSAVHNGIVLEYLDVHGVAGQTNKKTHASDFSRSSCIYLNAVDKTYFDDLLVQWNNVSDCGGGGIKMRPGNEGYLAPKVRVTNNTIDSCGGDGIVVSYAEAPLIDYNVAGNLGSGEYPLTGGNFAGMWVLGCHNAVISHNVVYNNSASPNDSEAFDCDFYNTGNCTVEYNYSHDNAGGAFLNCDGCAGTGSGVTQILRYNVFENDCRIADQGKKANFEFYQNVMYCPNKAFDVHLPNGSKIYNNIFVGNNDSTLPTSSKITYRYNVFYNVDRPASNGITHDPKFVDPGQYGYTLAAADGYKLQSSSPALDNGMIIADNGGYDFFGNAVDETTKPNRGAYQGAGL